MPDASVPAVTAPVWRRLHPATPVIRGWKVFAGVAAVAVQQSVDGVPPRWLALGVLVALPVAAAYGWLSWRFTRYAVTGEDLVVETGVLFRRSRRVRVDRLQAVDVVRPLVARALGLAELRLEVAGGSSAEAPLAYLPEPGALALRAELLARASGLDAATPEAPEAVLVTVPLRALVESALLSVGSALAVAAALALVVAAVVTGAWGLFLASGPTLFAAAAATVARVAGQYGFTLAESPDGLRIRRGLLETRAQTVPPGRIQAVRVVEPWLWRRVRGWARVEVNVAGYAGEQREQQHTAVLLPVAPRELALAVAARAVGADPSVAELATTGVPRSARLLDPVGWRFLRIGWDGRLFVSRRGRLRRETDLLPHERTQSMRLTQGWLQRRRGLATVHLDTTPGPVAVVAAHRDAREAREVVEAQARRARQARSSASPERWMTPRDGIPGP